MDRFGKEEFRELLDVDETPSVSIYMPIERQEMTNKALRLQFRARVDEAEQKLKAAESVEPDKVKEVMEPLRAMLDERNLFDHSGDGLAVFVAPGFESRYFLPLSFEAMTVVGSNFHTRPLLEHIAMPSDYWVLAIGEKEVSFWEGSPTGVEATEIEDLPKNLQEALMIEQEKGQDGLNYQTGSNYTSGGAGHDSGGGGSRSLPSPVYHGHGGGREERKAYLKRYFSEVSQGIQDYLGDAEGPVILAAVDFCHPIFEDASRLKNLADEGIEGNVHYWNDKSIYEAAWPIAKRQMSQRLDNALEEWERAYGKGSGEQDLATVGRRVIESRVHRLLLDEEAELWGQFDRTTGEVTRLEEGADEEAKAMAVDVYDEIAETVVQLGGDVVVVPSEKMPTNTGVAAILRGNG